MKTIITAATLLMLSVLPAVAETVTSCDPVLDPVEGLSQEEWNVLYIPDDWLPRTVARIETETGERYGKVVAVTVVELPETDVAVVFDESGCNYQVELDSNFF